MAAGDRGTNAGISSGLTAAELTGNTTQATFIPSL